MRIIVIDTETTGLPLNYDNSILDLNNWPHIIQLSYIIYDISSNIIVKKYNKIIKIENHINITDDSIKLHGITREISFKHGITINQALEELNKNLVNIDLIVGHNIHFDKKMILVEGIRSNIQINFTGYLDKPIPFYCTMLKSIYLCKIPFPNSKNPNNNRFKYPKLSELINYLFNEQPNNFHNSWVDVIYTLRAYCKLINNIDILTFPSINKELLDNINSY